MARQKGQMLFEIGLQNMEMCCKEVDLLQREHICLALDVVSIRPFSRVR
jgi:hypothetical protein